MSRTSAQFTALLAYFLGVAAGITAVAHSQFWWVVTLASGVFGFSLVSLWRCEP